MSGDGFRFGDAQARDDMGGCCGKPTGCGIESRGCVHKPEKAAWREAADAEVAARGKVCAVCGAVGNGHHHNRAKHLAEQERRRRELQREERPLKAVERLPREEPWERLLDGPEVYAEDERDLSTLDDEEGL